MNKSGSAWNFIYVLPNLVLSEDAEDSSPGAWPNGIPAASDTFAIVRANDARVDAIRNEVPAAAQILDSFVNQHGKPYVPAVLIASPMLSEGVRKNLDAIVAFRNAVAIPVLLRARAAVAVGGGSLDVTWADTFDFHPAQIADNGRMILQSPALLGAVSSTTRLTLTHSPYVPVAGRRLWPDRYLMRAIGSAWRRRFVPSQRRERFGASLFRSLELAYHALAVGAKNEGSMHDYGLEVAQWISAIEILAWPSRGHADIEGVLALLASIQARGVLKARRYRAKVRGSVRRLTALQRAYTYMYDARNRFLHGNPVSGSTLMTISRTERVGLPRLAALVYRAALVAYLAPIYSREPRSRDEMLAHASEMFDDYSYEEGLATLFGLDS